MGSRFATCLEGQHGCFSLESVTSHLFPEGSCPGGCCPDSGTHVPNTSRMSGPTTLVGSTAVDLFAGSRCPFLHGCLSKQGWTVTIETCSGRQGRKGAWHTLVDTYVPVKEGFLCGFPSVLFFFSFSLISYHTISKPLSLIHFPAVSFCLYFIIKLKCLMCLVKALSKKHEEDKP